MQKTLSALLTKIFIAHFVSLSEHSLCDAVKNQGSLAEFHDQHHPIQPPRLLSITDPNATVPGGAVQLTVGRTAPNHDDQAEQSSWVRGVFYTHAY